MYAINCLSLQKEAANFDSRYLNLNEFRKGWLHVADIEAEMKKRGESDLSCSHIVWFIQLMY